MADNPCIRALVTYPRTRHVSKFPALTKHIRAAPRVRAEPVDLELVPRSCLVVQTDVTHKEAKCLDWAVLTCLIVAPYLEAKLPVV